MAKLAFIVGWIGAAALGVAPFIINTTEGKILAIIGLALLLLQATYNRCYNLVLLNITGIAGYIYALYI